MQKIILYLHSRDLTQPSWAVVNENGAILQTSTNTHTDELAALAFDKEVIVVVPAEEVLLTHAKLPKLSRQKLFQALPFALEEQLLNDVSDLHFAIGPYQANDLLPVAVVNKSKIEAWISSLKDAGLQACAFIPATLALPVIKDSWLIVKYENIAIVRIDTFHGFACDEHNLKELLTSALASSTQTPQTITIHNYSQAPEPLKIDHITIIEKHFPTNQFIENIARNLETPAINLLQGPYQAKRKTSHSKKIWLAAGYLMLALVAFAFVSNIISFFILHHQTSLTQNAINTIYKRNFPQASNMVAPKERMSEKLNALSNQTGKNPILVWLGYIAKSLSTNSTLHIQQFDYRNNQLTLEFSAPTFSAVDAFTKSLSTYGIMVKQQNVATFGSQVKGTLLISEGNKS